MSEALEGSEVGHPDNKDMIEREIEFEQSLEIREAETRDIAYNMASEAGYGDYFKLAYILVFCTLFVTVMTYIFVARNELGGESAIIIGSLITLLASLSGQMISFISGSSIGSRNKGKSILKELAEADG